MPMMIQSGYLQESVRMPKTNGKKEHPVKEDFAGKITAKEAEQAKELTPEEEMEIFKKEFYAEIEKIPKHPTVANVAVKISEEGFKKMKDDPEYKEKMLNLLKRDMGNSLAPRKCSVILTIGASSSEYRGDCWPITADSEFDMRSQNSFYKKSSEKKDKSKELLEEYLQKRMEQKQLVKEMLVKKEDEEARVNDLLRSEAGKAYDNRVLLK